MPRTFAQLEARFRELDRKRPKSDVPAVLRQPPRPPPARVPERLREEVKTARAEDPAPQPQPQPRRPSSAFVRHAPPARGPRPQSARPTSARPQTPTKPAQPRRRPAPPPAIPTTVDWRRFVRPERRKPRAAAPTGAERATKSTVARIQAAQRAAHAAQRELEEAEAAAAQARWSPRGAAGETGALVAAMASPRGNGEDEDDDDDVDLADLLQQVAAQQQQRFRRGPVEDDCVDEADEEDEEVQHEAEQEPQQPKAVMFVGEARARRELEERCRALAARVCGEAWRPRPELPLSDARATEAVVRLTGAPADWTFDVVLSDVTDALRRRVTLPDVRVDAEGLLQWPQGGTVLRPVELLPWVERPEQLHRSGLRIEVTATAPVRLWLVDASVFFKQEQPVARKPLLSGVAPLAPSSGPPPGRSPSPPARSPSPSPSPPPAQSPEPEPEPAPPVVVMSPLRSPRAAKAAARANSPLPPPQHWENSAPVIDEAARRPTPKPETSAQKRARLKQMREALLADMAAVCASSL